MQSGLKKAFEEVGKHFLNVCVAIIVFAIIQPLVNGTFNLKLAVYSAVAYFTLFVSSIILLVLGGTNNE